jgi:endonuclease/exonuclease/phosphatase (EEP) superfamily protein YafD
VPSEQDPEEDDFDAERDRSERRHALLAALGWLVTLPLLLVATLRLFLRDASPELIALNAMTPWVYLPVWAIIPLAFRAQRRPLLVCASMLAVLHLLWLDPTVLLASPQPPWAERGQRLRVMSVNLLAMNRDTEGIAQEIIAQRPDILVTQELAPHWAARFDADDVRNLLPHRRLVVRDDAFGIGVYARAPVRAESFELHGLPALRIESSVGGRQLCLFGVHTLPPTSAKSMRTWSDMIGVIAARIRRERGPVVLAGDVNATPHTGQYQELLRTGLRGAHEDRGRGWATTWPNGRLPVPPIRLDHVLVSKDIAVLSVREGEGRGSDHRPVIVEVAVAP